MQTFSFGKNSKTYSRTKFYNFIFYKEDRIKSIKNLAKATIINLFLKVNKCSVLFLFYKYICFVICNPSVLHKKDKIEYRYETYIKFSIINCNI